MEVDRTQTAGRVAELLAEGLTQAEIARRLGKSRGSIAYHVRRLGVPPDPRFARRHDWAEIQRYYDAGHSVRECIARFGFSTKTWYDARARGDIVPRPQAMPIDLLLIGPRNRSHVRRRLLATGLKNAACEACGIEEWRGQPVPLQLHHVNGVGTDNRLENLQLLCPNCHALTDNWSGRNKGRAA